MPTLVATGAELLFRAAGPLAGRIAPSSRVVLMYHSVAPTPVLGGLSVHPDELAWQLGWVGRRYRFAPLAEVLSAPPGERLAAVTFDDGYAHLIPETTDLLRAHGVPALFYMPTALMGEPLVSSYGASPVMDAAAVQALADAGFAVGSHARTHRKLTELGPEELEQEVSGSKQELEALLGAPVEDFAYPSGAQNALVRQAVRRAGYQRATGVVYAGLDEGFDPFAIPRIGVYGHTSRARLRFALTAWGDVYARWRGLGRQPARSHA